VCLYLPIFCYYWHSVQLIRLHLKTLYNDIKKYIELRLELAGLELQENLTELAIRLLMLIVVVVILGSFLGFLNLALAFYIGDLLNKQSLGFLVVALIYLVLGLVFLALYRSRKTQLKAYILNMLTKIVNNKPDNHG